MMPVFFFLAMSFVYLGLLKGVGFAFVGFDRAGTSCLTVLHKVQIGLR